MESTKLDNGSEIKFKGSPKWDKLVSHSDSRLGYLELISSGDRCGKSIFTEQYMCEWTPDLRMVELEDMVVNYYKEITYEMSARECRLHRKEFVQHCKDGGYSRYHINKVMQDALGRNDI